MGLELEKYKGTKSRYTCPSCGSRNCFARYVENTGDYLSEDVGRCNRESKCGYHKKPKDFFAENPQIKSDFKKRKKRAPNYGFVETHTQPNPQTAQDEPDFIPFGYFKPTLGNYERNAFVRFLLNLFQNSANDVQTALKSYFIGTYETYTCFPYIDRSSRICKAKLIRFDHSTGKRLKSEFDTSSLSAKLKLGRNYKQSFFGEHLLENSDKPIAVVESEKTAVIASICLPQFIWLATGSKQSLKPEKIAQIGQKEIILYPDADGFELWQEIALQSCFQNLSVKVSSLIEETTTDEQKANGFDLADLLIDEQITRLEQQKNFTEVYNAKLEAVLNDEKLKDDFETILDEQKWILVDRGLSEAAAENLIRNFDNLREVVLSI